MADLNLNLGAMGQGVIADAFRQVFHFFQSKFALSDYDCQFIDYTHKSVNTEIVAIPHSLGFIPLDVIVTYNISGAVIQPLLSSKTSVSFQFTAPGRLRMFVGTYRRNRT